MQHLPRIYLWVGMVDPHVPHLLHTGSSWRLSDLLKATSLAWAIALLALQALAAIFCFFIW